MEAKKRVQLMFNVQNDTIINKIMKGFKIMMNRIKWIVATILNKLENVLIWIGYNWVGYKVDIIALEEDNRELDNKIKALEKDVKALELAITMSKNDNNNLQESFNEYVLRPKAEKMIKEFVSPLVEDYEGGK